MTGVGRTGREGLGVGCGEKLLSSHEASLRPTRVRLVGGGHFSASQFHSNFREIGVNLIE
mgnify:CR=1 FL=1